jgi:hypothetical protein
LKSEGEKKRIKNLKPFKKGQSGNLNGRPASVSTKIKKEMKKMKLDSKDVASLIADVLLDQSSNKISRLKDANLTNLEEIIIAAVIKTKKDGNLDRLLDRSIGKPMQAIDHTSSDGSANNQVVVVLPDNGH